MSEPGWHAGAGQHRLDVVQEVVAQELPARHVDAREDRRLDLERALPGRELAPGALEREDAEVDDQPGLLGDRDEGRGREAAEPRMVPAQQRLEAGDGAVLEPHDRLEQDLDLAAVDGAPQVALEGEPIAGLGPHRRPEHLDAVAAMALRMHHRDLGVLEHLLAPSRGLALVEHQPDRGGQEDLALLEGDRRRRRAPNHVGEADDPVGIVLRHQDDPELVAVDAGERVVRLQEPAEATRQRQEDRVAGGEADRVVHLLEAVEIEARARSAGCPRPAPQG